MAKAITIADDVWIKQTPTSDALTISVGGQWVVARTAGLFAHLQEISMGIDRPVTFDISEVEVLDTAGAWLIYRTGRQLRENGIEVQIVGANDDQAMMLQQAADNDVSTEIEAIPDFSLKGMVGDVGAGVVGVVQGAVLAALEMSPLTDYLDDGRPFT
jgi:phospholipid/cholesterol/gamma-HCH transport system permease protein